MITTNLDTSPKSETLELHSRAVPSVEAHHRSDGPDTERNSGSRRIIIKKMCQVIFFITFIVSVFDFLVDFAQIRSFETSDSCSSSSAASSANLDKTSSFDANFSVTASIASIADSSSESSSDSISTFEGAAFSLKNYFLLLFVNLTVFC